MTSIARMSLEELLTKGTPDEAANKLLATGQPLGYVLASHLIRMARLHHKAANRPKAKKPTKNKLKLHQ